MRAIETIRQQLLAALAPVAASVLRAAFETRMDPAIFDPVLSRQLDCADYLLESMREKE